MALISSLDFDNLPIEPIARWLKLRDLLELRLEQVTNERDGISDENLIEYCTVLISAAEELEFGEFSEFSVGDIRQNYLRVRSEIIALATKLSIRASKSNAAYSVALPRISKAKLFEQIERLRALVANSELPSTQKDKLSRKLDELHLIVVSGRADYAKLMAVVAFIAMGLGGTTSFLADAPDAIATITAIVGEAKAAEEEDHRLLEAEKEPLQLPDLREGTDNDHEIPF